jgi:hypothetical protein
MDSRYGTYLPLLLLLMLDPGTGADAKVTGLTRTHSLRYVLKNRETNKELFVINISLLPTEEAKKEGASVPEEKFAETHGGKETENDDLD